ncbi:MAG: hypothetical protein IT581_00985 [Verrucomicrobiales bacterium]|nr:hypothetical protein [Verrucomicrobiales bacterium]
MPNELFLLRLEHEDAFYKAGVDRFKRRARVMLRRRYPNELKNVSDSEVLLWIDKWTEQVRPHHLLTEEQMFSYYEAGIILRRHGIDILHSEQVRKVLNSDLPPNQKSQHILDMARSSDQKVVGIVE